MRKFFALLLVLCLACAACSALAGGSYAGVWYLVRMRTAQGADVSLTGSDVQIIFDLKEDGTAVMTMTQGGESLSDSGSWKENAGTVTVTDSSGASRDLEVRGDELEMASGGGYMVFSRALPSAEIPQVPAVRAESPEQFNGLWVMFRVLQNGMLADQGSIAADQVPTVAIGDGKLIETAFNESGLAVQYVYDCTFADGTLTAAMTDDSGTLSIVLSLLEDGTLQGVINGGTPEELVIWYRPAEEAAEAPAA